MEKEQRKEVLAHIDENDNRIKFIRGIVVDTKPRKVLDVGCGKGAMLKHFISWEIETYGVDISEELIWRAGKDNPKANVYVGSATQLPFDNDTFDMVVASELLEHVHTWKMAISEMIRVTKKNGVVIIIDKDRYAIFHRIWFAANALLSKELHFVNVLREKWFRPDELLSTFPSYDLPIAAKKLDNLFIGVAMWIKEKRCQDGAIRYIRVPETE
jgi:ubiquinone/menaquinone biosynthesis C-methylase UbiE